MNIRKYFKDGLLIKVIPNSNEASIAENNGQIKIYLKSPPRNNKANLELIKFFKKEFNLRVEIVSGLRGRKKVLMIKNG